MNVISRLLVAAPFLRGHPLLQQTSITPSPFPERHPLPVNPYPQNLKPDVHAAYDQCLQSQAEAGNDATLFMYARCLGWLIIEAPNDAARDYISHEIVECQGNGDQMNALAHLYISHLFRLFRRDKCCTPTSRPSFEDERFFLSSAVAAPTDHSVSKGAALERDNFCCMVTGDVETAYYRSLSINDRNTRYPNPNLTHTHFAHIFPPSTSQGLKPEQPSNPKTHYVGSVMSSIVLNYGGTDILNELDGSDCHRLSNGLTLASPVHEEFDRLCLWFENAPHTYRVCTLFPYCSAVKALPHPRTVTFTTTTNHPLPDPRYLKLHAVICRVGHLSGVTEYLDMYDNAQEERRFLANDGSSAEYLASRLHSVLSHKVVL